MDAMQQQTRRASILHHLYPGVVITACFVALTPRVVALGYPPQFSMLLCIVGVAIPLLLMHLRAARKKERLTSIRQLNGYTERLPAWRLVSYSLGLVVVAFIAWGVLQPVDQLITASLLSWLPDWYTVQDFSGYGREAIITTLVANLVLNGILAPVVEEIYFRGYLLPRMEAWRKWAFVANAALFSLYHFWQPYIYLTLMFALLPMTYLVWKTKDLRLGILTHCLLNLVGALLTMAMLLGDR
jgi:hypothetical protein